jgi:hypothetical protein
MRRLPGGGTEAAESTMRSVLMESAQSEFRSFEVWANLLAFCFLP